MSLTPQEQALHELASRELARRRFLPYVQRTVPKYQAGWVHEDVARQLEWFLAEIVAGRNPHMMLLMPPRHGKTQQSGMCFPAWAIGQVPDLQFISCAYNVSLSGDFSKKVKEQIESPDYSVLFPHVKPDPNNWSVETWSTLNEDGAPANYVAAGVGGGITGKGADILYIDDPVKNAEEADSKDYMEKLWTWYGSTAYTRLSPRGGVLLVQTPWSDMDLSGRIQNEMAEALRDRDEDTPQFKVVKYQAIAEQYEYRNRETREIIQRHDELHADDAAEQHLELLRVPGEPLHPDRYNRQRLLRIKKTMPLRFWSAQFQQNPVPDDGAYFSASQLRRAPIPEDLRYCRIIMPWDFAISEKQTNDYTVGCALIHDPDDHIHVAEIMRFRSGNALEIVNAMIALARRWSHTNLTICVEDGQIWRTMKVLFDKRCAEEKFYPSVQVMKPVTDKLARARPLQGRLQHGTVTFNADPSADNWYMTCRSEMLRFPAGAHDDQTDSLAWGVTAATENPAPQRPQRKPLKSWRDELKGFGRGSVGSHMTA